MALKNLKKPRAIAIYDERIFVTEQDGFIRVIQNDKKRSVCI